MKRKIKPAIFLCLLALTGCEQLSQLSGNAGAAIAPQKMADALHSVIQADRTVYTQYIVNRLAVERQVIKASEHWADDNALLLPAQMLRLGSEMVAENNAGFSYALLSQWPINKQNKPKTDKEIEGLKYFEKHPGENFYAEEILGDKKYFTAVYPDMAVSEACIKCHNNHTDSPRNDFKLGETMGGIVIRIPM